MKKKSDNYPLGAHNAHKVQLFLFFQNMSSGHTTVPAPTLFTIYTEACRSCFQNIPILKYADDTSIQALIKKN